MKTIKDNWYWIGIILVLVSLLLSQCHNNKLTKKDTKEFTTVSNKKEALNVIYVHDTIIKKFHEIKTITKVVQEVKIDTIKILFKDSIPCIFNRSGEIKTKYYTLGYKINNKALKVDNLKIEDSLIVVSGNTRKWFLGRETNAIDVSHSNRYFYNSNVQHVEITSKKRFYDTRLFNIGVGVLVGVGISK